METQRKDIKNLPYSRGLLTMITIAALPTALKHGGRLLLLHATSGCCSTDILSHRLLQVRPSSSLVFQRRTFGIAGSKLFTGRMPFL